MPVTPISKVVTANDLKSGEVIYLRFPHSWTPDLTKASVITDRDLAKASLVFRRNQQRRRRRTINIIITKNTNWGFAHNRIG